MKSFTTNEAEVANKLLTSAKKGRFSYTFRTTEDMCDKVVSYLKATHVNVKIAKTVEDDCEIHADWFDKNFSPLNMMTSSSRHILYRGSE